MNAVKKLTKTVYERLNPAGQQEGLDPRLRGDDGFEKQVALFPSPPIEGERQGEGVKIAASLSDDAIQSNQRLATSLTKRTDVGDLPRFTADAINTDSAKAIPEIVDLIREVETSDPKQAHQLYQQTLQGITPENQRRLEDTYALSLSGGEEDETLKGGDEYDQLPDREKSRLRFPDNEDQDHPTNLERIQRKLSSEKKVTQDIPEYKPSKTQPITVKGEIRDTIHRLGLDPKMEERFTEKDVETLRQFERFKHLDEKETAQLNERLTDLQKRDENLVFALVQKKYNATHFPEEETWSMSDAELKTYQQKLKRKNPIGVHMKNEIRQGLESSQSPYIGGMFSQQKQVSGKELNPEERILKNLEFEIQRRENWKNQQ